MIGPIRLALAGNGLAGCLALDLLLEVYDAGDLLVIAPPPGTTPEWQESLADRAGDRGVGVLEPDRVNDEGVVDALRARGTDLLLSVYYTQIFRPALLRAVDGPALNVHPALLPRHRGTAPLIWAIIEGDHVTGVSVHELTEGIDDGPLVYQAPLPIHPDDTGYSLHVKAAYLAAALVADLLRRATSGRPLPAAREQTGPASYHSKRDPRLNHIDWVQPRHRIRDVVRALAPPLPGAYADLDGDRLIIEQVDTVDAVASVQHSPGVLDVSSPEGPVVVWAGDGPLRLSRASVRGRALADAELAAMLVGRTGTVLR